MSLATMAMKSGTIARVYLVTLLLLAVVVSSPFQIGLALVLLIIQMFCAYRSSNASSNLVLTIVSLVFAPLVLEALVGKLFAVLLMVPALFLLDHALRDYAVTQVVSFSREGRKASKVLKAIAVDLILVFLVSIISWNLTLTLAVAFLLGYVSFVSAYILLRVPKTPLGVNKTLSRVVVGDTDSRTTSFVGKARLPLRVFMRPMNPWVDIEPSSFALTSQGRMEATLRFTPLLAGPSTIRLETCSIDAWGLTVSNQVLEPVDFHMIPKARYAQWLANKFLEQTSFGTGLSVTNLQSSPKPAKHGDEYYGSRPYQPGDRLKDLDWKHSYMLGELIVKNFSGAQGNKGVIVADLTAKDAEAADKLAYNFVMSALTLAKEGLPVALAVYNQDETLAVTSLTNPREILKKTLKLTERIAIVEPKEKVLQLIETRRLKRFIEQLSMLQDESSHELSELLKFELAANQETAKQHPATHTLAKATGNMQGPALIIVASPIDESSGALLLALERLRERGYRTVMVSQRLPIFSFETQ
jgi:uncharacterized protein (DUF58 family)